MLNRGWFRLVLVSFLLFKNVRVLLLLLLEQCYVVSTGKSGCFVRLAGGVSGRVLLKLLSDRYVDNPALEFPCGRLVAGKVLEKVGGWNR